jgi:hypothetical protein
MLLLKIIKGENESNMRIIISFKQDFIKDPAEVIQRNMGNKRALQRVPIFVWTTERKGQAGKPKHEWGGNMKINIKEVGNGFVWLRIQSMPCYFWIV